MKKVILASASPRRSELLKSLGIDFEVVVSDADESKIDKKSVPASIYVQELALLKGTAVANTLKKRDGIIISADTIVYSEGKILGKPKDREDAKRMLENLSGKCHSVFTGICVMNAKNMYSVCTKEETKVYFKELTKQEIEDYIDTKEPFDKAGAYGIQGIGGILIDKIEGDFFNVVGLPLSRLAKVLKKEFDFDIFKERKNEV